MKLERIIFILGLIREGLEPFLIDPECGLGICNILNTLRGNQISDQEFYEMTYIINTWAPSRAVIRSYWWDVEDTESRINLIDSIIHWKQIQLDNIIWPCNNPKVDTDGLIDLVDDFGV